MNADLKLTDDSFQLDFGSLKVDQQCELVAGGLTVIEALSGMFV